MKARCEHCGGYLPPTSQVVRGSVGRSKAPILTAAWDWILAYLDADPERWVPLWELRDRGYAVASSSVIEALTRSGWQSGTLERWDDPKSRRAYYRRARS